MSSLFYSTFYHFRNERSLVNSYGDRSLQDYMNNIPNPNVPSQQTRNSWDPGLTKEVQGIVSQC